MNVKNVAIKLEKLAMLKFFPSDEGARLGILELVCKMAHTEAQVDWLVNRMTDGLYNEWPGPAELRACFCSKFPPKDGRSVFSQVYADGIPSEKEATNRLILGPVHAKGLIEGHQEPRQKMQVGIDPGIQRIARMKDLNRVVKRNSEPISPQRRAEIQSQIDAIERANRDKRAREEAGL
jgi:hypothetical protein